MTQRIAVLSILLAGALGLSACANTIRGAGADLDNSIDATEAAVADVAQ